MGKRNNKNKNILPKARKFNFAILFQLEIESKKATTKTTILPKAKKTNFSMPFQEEFE